MLSSLLFAFKGCFKAGIGESLVTALDQCPAKSSVNFIVRLLRYFNNVTKTWKNGFPSNNLFPAEIHFE